MKFNENNVCEIKNSKIDFSFFYKGGDFGSCGINLSINSIDICYMMNFFN